MNSPTTYAVILSLAMWTFSLTASQSSHDRHSQVTARGDRVMGFSHERTTHHFRLTANGGVIEATAKSEEDQESVRSIRSHFQHIAKKFAAGDFQAPMLIHAQKPPGVPVMKTAAAKITYLFAEIPAGGRVTITSADKRAVDAIHEFLRFQIQDHKTGDPLTVKP